MNVHVASYRSAIEPSSAYWTAKDTRGGDVFKLTASPEVISALEEIELETASVPLDYIRRRQYCTPALESLMKDIEEVLFDGCGVVRLVRLPTERWSVTQSIKAYWGLALHLGHPAIQDVAGSRVGHVRQEPGGSAVRGYRSSKELTFHSDAYELLGLMCLERAASGGITRIVSAEAVFRVLLQEYPETIQPLMKGFWYLPLEAGENRGALTRHPVPVFSVSQQRVRCMYLPKYMRDAAQAMRTELPAELEHALRAFREVANREELVCEFDLDPGEILFCNNFAMLHSRTEFVDRPDRPRHLVRLWLNSRSARIIDPALLERGYVYDRLHREQRYGS